MRIKNLTYKDNASSWELRQIELDQLNLLVGVSGVGKTMSLKAIRILAQIVTSGLSANGVAWKVTFIDESDRECIWEGEFENLGMEKKLASFFDNQFLEVNEENIGNEARIISETVIINNVELIKRNKQEIIFNGKPTLKLSQTESVINLLKEENEITPIYQSFNKIIRSKTLTGGRIVEFNKISTKFTSLETIQNSHLDTFLKLALLSKHEPTVFNDIKDNFISIFPHIEDMCVQLIENNNNLPVQVSQFPFLHIKEKHIDRWIFPWELSNGMLKTLGIISDLYLLPAGSVLLIDELENSLGINCIDDIGDLLSANSDIQLIVTSHHPYIINTIDMQYWKILTRQGSVVTGRKAQEFERLAKKSMHDNYTRLLEIEEILQGVKA